MPVHLYGMECNMSAINAIAQEHNLQVIEDCAQYHCRRDDCRCNVQCYSFYPGKNLGALGDAGAVCTDDEQVATAIRQIAFYGSEKKYVHIYKGLNSRMDELQAAVLRIKLRDLDRCNERRKEIARRYIEEIKTVTLPPMAESTVWHIFTVFTPRRYALQQYLADKGIGTQIHYPIPPHKQQAYKEWSTLCLPITERIAKEELSLPCNQSMTDEEVEYVIKAINAFEA
jgi:dTDP-4-amino-4,6-dideoxygalactose transaminase